MSDKEKLRRLIEQGHDYYYSDAYNGASVYEAIAEYLIMKGVRLKEGPAFAFFLSCSFFALSQGVFFIGVLFRGVFLFRTIP